MQPLPLTPPDVEMLRCVGLDTFVMIRFLIFGFDLTFYPFLFALVTLIPLYYTNDYKGHWQNSDGDSGFNTTVTDGYFRLTINRLESNSPKLWLTWAFAIFYYCAVLRRLWVEWVVFVELRRDFLINGDPNSVKEDDRESVQQYRKTCLVEFVPRE